MRIIDLTPVFILRLGSHCVKIVYRTGCPLLSQYLSYIALLYLRIMFVPFSKTYFVRCPTYAHFTRSTLFRLGIFIVFWTRSRMKSFRRQNRRNYETKIIKFSLNNLSSIRTSKITFVAMAIITDVF